VLFHNRGDGTFEPVDVGSPIRDGADNRLGARWVDYDNDGFLDLFMTCGTSWRNHHVSAVEPPLP
jgi:hypothetical protein